MTRKALASETRRTSAGLGYRMVGTGRPLLLLHGLMVSGEMFDPLAERLQGEFRMLIPDLRGHGASGAMAPPFDVESMAGDVAELLDETDSGSAAVLGYSHGGAVAQALARVRPSSVGRLFLVCTYACNVSTLRERMEGWALVALLSFVRPATLAGAILQPSQGGGERSLTADQVAWLRMIMGANGRAQMRGAAEGLLTFDSRPWLKDIRAPTLVIAGADDTAVPAHHFDALTLGIPGAMGAAVQGAGHTLIWTHTDELADLVRDHARLA